VQTFAKVEEAERFIGAQEWGSKQLFDTVVIDWSIAGRQQFLKRVVEQYGYSPTHVVAMGALAERRKVIAEALESNITRFCSKPLRDSLPTVVAVPTAGDTYVSGSNPDLEKAPEVDSHSDVAPAPKPSAGTHSGGTLPRILVVDDNEANRMLLSLYLERFPCELTVAENGRDAVNLVREREFDLILMDGQMPVLDGYSATSEIRSFEKAQGRRRVPVAALTAHALEEERQRSAAAGCDAHLTKPLRMERLLEFLNSMFPNSACSNAPLSSEATHSSDGSSNK
jgi:CheY-like chemotaxis protein